MVYLSHVHGTLDGLVKDLVPNFPSAMLFTLYPWSNITTPMSSKGWCMVSSKRSPPLRILLRGGDLLEVFLVHHHTYILHHHGVYLKLFYFCYLKRKFSLCHKCCVLTNFVILSTYSALFNDQGNFSLNILNAFHMMEAER